MRMKRPNRIYIMGPSGCGKTTLSNKLSKKLKITSYDLDDVFWVKKPIKKRGEKLLKPRLKKLIQKKKWIIEGVFHSWIDSAIEKSDLIVLIDISPRILSWRLFRRYLKRKFKGEPEGDFKDILKLIKYGLIFLKNTDPQNLLDMKI